MIKKLKVAAYLLFIVQNSVFAESSINCMKGVKVGENEGYEENGKIVMIQCYNLDSCLRLEIDIISAPNGDNLENVAVMDCVSECKTNFENQNQPELNAEAAMRLGGQVGQTFGREMTDARARCCRENECNSEPPLKPTQQPETSGGSKLSASLTLFIVLVVNIFN